MGRDRNKRLGRSSPKARTKRAGAGLRLTQQALARIFDTCPDYIVVVRSRDRHVVAVNGGVERVTGYRADEVVGRKVGELHMWVDARERDRLRATLELAGTVRDWPAKFRRKDGKVISCLISSTVAELDGEKMTISVVRDVTRDEETERRLHSTQSKLASVFEQVCTPIAVSTRDGVFVAVNEAWERASGMSREQALGRRGLTLGHWTDPGQRARIVERVEAGERVEDELVTFRRPNGTLREVLLSCVRIDWDGEPHWLWSSRDVTALRQAEAKFATLFATNPTGMLVTRPSDRVIIEMNDAALRIAGVTRAEAIGRRTDEIVRILNKDETDELRRRTIAGETPSAPLHFERRDGTRVEAMITGALVQIDGAPHFVLSVMDVTEQRRAERERGEAERKFAALFENSPEPISLFRVSDGVRLAANAAWERVSGHSRDGAAQRPAVSMSLFPDKEERERLIARVVAEGRISNVEQRLVRADGTQFDARISGVCLDIERQRCILWNWSDISDQRRVEQAKREADARYRALFETALDGMVITTRDMEIVDVNPVIGAMTGFAREELIGKPVSALYSAQELAMRPLRRYDADDSWSILERTLERKGGGEVSVEVLAGPMPDGNVLAIMRDITERKRNENLLMNVARGVSAELGDAFFRSLVEHLARELQADFAFIAELEPGGERCRTRAFVADGTIAPNFEYSLAGSPCETAVERRGTVIYPRGVAERFPDDVALARRGISAYVGTSLHAADGSPLGVLVVMNRKPVTRGPFWGSMIEIFGARAAAEIERARAEALVRRTNESLERVVRERTAELAQANEELESYNFSISHDLRQPLNAIAGFAELMRDSPPGASPEIQADCLREIEHNAARMEQMIDALLRLSRAGRGALRKKEIDMRDLAEAVVRDLSVAAPLPASIQIGDLPRARGEDVLVRQVWANLIGNAIKYSRKHPSPRVEISGERRNGAAEFIVRDNGVGFDMRDSVRVFDPFQRLPSGKEFEGSGVGLAIVQRIVRRHGGTISAESSPGQGATFRFTIPD